MRLPTTKTSLSVCAWIDTIGCVLMTSGRLSISTKAPSDSRGLVIRPTDTSGTEFTHSVVLASSPCPFVRRLCSFPIVSNPEQLHSLPPPHNTILVTSSPEALVSLAGHSSAYHSWREDVPRRFYCPQVSSLTMAGFGCGYRNQVGVVWMAHRAGGRMIYRG